LDSLSSSTKSVIFSLNAQVLATNCPLDDGPKRMASPPLRVLSFFVVYSKNIVKFSVIYRQSLFCDTRHTEQGSVWIHTDLKNLDRKNHKNLRILSNTLEFYRILTFLHKHLSIIRDYFYPDSRYSSRIARALSMVLVLRCSLSSNWPSLIPIITGSTQALFSSPLHPHKNFCPSHRIFGHINETLNVDKK
jgi:hypothetical protein